MDIKGEGITPAPPEAAAEEAGSDGIEGRGLKMKVAVTTVFFDLGMGIPVTLEALEGLGITAL